MQVCSTRRHYESVFSRKINPPVHTDDGCEVSLLVLQTLLSPNITLSPPETAPGGPAVAQPRKIVICQVNVRREMRRVHWTLIYCAFTTLSPVVISGK